MSYQLVNIAKLTEKVQKWNPLKEDGNISFRYFDLSCIDKEGKKIIEEEIFTINKVEAPSRARQLIKSDDILVSTVRPNLNGLAKISSTQPNDTASTGFCVLRANEVLNNNYLFYWLQSKKFVNEMILKATGASYPAVSDKIIKNSKIPLPPLKTQKRISQILDYTAALRDKTKKLLAEYDLLAQSIFLEMFGDPLTNPKKWKVCKLKELSTKIGSGNTPKGGSKVYVDEGITFFRSQNVWKNNLVMDEIAFINQETHEGMKKSSLKHRDILMTKTGRINTENSSLGRAAMYLGEDDKANLNGHVYLIRLKKDVLNEYILFILTTNQYREHIRRVCVGGIDKRQLNKNHLEEFPIIYPPMELQKEFTEKLKLIKQQKELAKQELKESKDLFNCLLQKAFKGELV